MIQGSLLKAATPREQQQDPDGLRGIEELRGGGPAHGPSARVPRSLPRLPLPE